jgi:hypothetical protein
VSGPGPRILALRARIARQRVQLASQLGALEGPLQVLEGARALLKKLPGRFLLVLVAACAGFAAIGLLPGARRAAQLASKAARWWAIARVGLQLVRTWRASAP